jgi:hypothetical protein
MPRARFFFDGGSGAVLWMVSEQDWPQWGQPVDVTRLPISTNLRDELVRLAEWYDKSLNWDYPSDPGPWRQPECDRFNEASRRALIRMREELGPDWEIADEFWDVHEDPHLDRYLADPRGFRR